MQKFKVTGMSCAACSARVEKAVKAVNGSKNVSVNLLTGDLSVEGDALKEDIVNAVISAGYGIEEPTENAEQKHNGKEFKAIKKRLILSVIILFVLMYFSMFNMLFSVPLPQIFVKNPAALGVFELILTLAVCIINRNFFINGIKGIIYKAPNMDTLVSLGAASSFLYSLYIVLKQISGNPAKENHLYFESAAMILTLITIGKLLEAKAKSKTVSVINSLKELAPENAVILKDGREVRISSSSLKKGDIFIVRAGESIPADGVILEGSAAVDESAVTGESIPVTKKAGDSVTSVTVNRNGVLKCRAEAVGKDSIFQKIIDTVNDAAATKAPIARVADKVAGVFVPAVLIIAVLTLIIWLILGKSGGFALQRAISVLVISCPCALGLATPVAITVASGVGAKCGILYKNAAVLELCGKVKTVILDKTGTVTEGVPRLTDIFSENENDLIATAYSLEKNSSHPLSNAVCEYAKDICAAKEVSDFKEIPGIGIEGITENAACFGGNLKAASERADIQEEYISFCERVENEGKTPLVFIKDGKPLGVIAVSDTVKKDSKSAVSALKAMGIKVIMLTGDNAVTANAIAGLVGIDDVTAGVLPNGKADAVREYKKASVTAMVGDGINDAPALTVADVGIAIGGGKDIASKAADLVLMKNSLWGVVTALALGRKTLKNIKENLFWAFLYNCLCIPLAAGAFISLFGWELNPMLGAAAMSLSSFCVVMNALRLNFFKPASKNTLDKTEEKTMNKTIKITGMMCPHCEAHVKTALEAIDGVISAAPSHEKGEAAVTLSKPVGNEILTKAVTDAGYTVTDIRE